MRVPWLSLTDAEQRAFRTAHAFLAGRLMERQVFEWALGLSSRRQAERIALSEVFQESQLTIKEPWNSAWGLLLDSWEQPVDQDESRSDFYRVRTRLSRGDRSSQLAARVVDLVRPYIEIKSRSAYPGSVEASRLRPPRKLADLASVQMSSGDIVDFDLLGLGAVRDLDFLVEVAAGLDSALRAAFALGKRMGFTSGRWHFEMPHRVYAVSDAQGGEEDPDEYHRGLPPVVKLLYAVVDTIGRLDLAAFKAILSSWQNSTLSIHKRMWLAMARNEEFASPSEVEKALSDASDESFWGMGRDSEIPELRAARFKSLSRDAQTAIERKVRRGPPRRFWSKVESARIQEIKEVWAARELQRIKIGGGTLSKANEAWLSDRLAESEELRLMAAVDHDFSRSFFRQLRGPVDDGNFDRLSGAERLAALESSISAVDGMWDDSIASTWIRAGSNSTLVLHDLESVPESGSAYPEVWNRFGWAHLLSEVETADESEPTGENGEQVDRVLALLMGISLSAAASAIDGISAFLDRSRSLTKESDLLVPVWRRLWPVAYEMTNLEHSSRRDRQEQGSRSEEEEGRIDTLNNPAGKFYGVFIERCPSVKDGERPFSQGSELREMRDAMYSAPGHAGLVVKYRMLEQSEWFFAADPDWAKDHLFVPLQADSLESLMLWGAVARRHHFKTILSAIGPQIMERAIDSRLSRDVRRTLAASVVLEALHALNDERQPVFPRPDISQMIRSLDEEVRARVAGVIQKFAEAMSNQNSQKWRPAEVIFSRSVRPFLQTVWPQEAMLTTPGVARALADLPIACGESFPDAVEAISHFLVPFDVWSMHEYGLTCRGEGRNIGLINTPEKGAALLRLIDMTVSEVDGTPVPHDLGDALEQVRDIAPELTESSRYRRLATLARR